MKGILQKGMALSLMIWEKYWIYSLWLDLHINKPTKISSDWDDPERAI
jgi:hypothetical protein